ncbi:MAG: DUF4124 domain-containing protein [Methylococcaceae bacterium]
MPVQIFRVTFFLSCLICLTASPAIFAKKMYRLEDENGKTVYTDQIPPEKSVYRRELLNPHGRVVEVTEKAKTKEQQELEKRLTLLRKEEDVLIAKQKTHDNALLNTFHAKEDILEALKVKMQLFEAQRKVIEGNLKRITEQLEKQQKIAANYERNGQKVHQKILDDIKTTGKQVEQLRTALIANSDEQDHVKKEYNADYERFLFLTQSVKKQTPITKVPSIKEANMLGLFYCENDHQCNKAWDIARTFVETHSTTPPDVYNSKLIMNRPPSKDTDISLSLSRIAVTDTDYQLFLDIHCYNSTGGKQLCSSQKIKELRLAFRPYVNDTLSRTSQQ